MEITHTSFADYELLSFDGELRLEDISSVTPRLSRCVQTGKGAGLVLDMSKLRFVDSNGIRLFLNLKKRLDEKGRPLYLLRPTDQVMNMFEDANLKTVFTILDSNEDLQKRLARSTFEAYLPYSREQGDVRRLLCSCAVCGSTNVVGYLIDPNNFDWTWSGDDPFPTASVKNTDTVVDVLALMPVICLDCYMCSIEVNNFHATDESQQITRRGILPENAKLLLSKSIKKRKKMLDAFDILPEDFFKHPRSRDAAYLCYLFAESCARTMALEKAVSTPFTIGYLNYLTIRYSTFEQKSTLIDNSRTWLTQVLNERENYTHIELAKSYFILIVACLNLEKITEASTAHQYFADMIEILPENTGSSGINCPFFWFRQAENIWKREIDSRSKTLRGDG